MLSRREQGRDRAQVPACQQVWHKLLSGRDRHAIAVVNYAGEPANVTCGEDCFAQVGSTAPAALRAFDVWRNVTVGNATAAGFQCGGGDLAKAERSAAASVWCAPVPPQGGSFLFVLSPGAPR